MRRKVEAKESEHTQTTPLCLAGLPASASHLIDVSDHGVLQFADVGVELLMLLRHQMIVLVLSNEAAEQRGEAMRGMR